MREVDDSRRTSQWVYDGICPRCDKRRRIVVLTRHGEMMLPPSITASCQCAIPVTTMDLFYQNTYEGRPV